MLPSSRSNGPAVVCHQMGLESEGKGGGVEEERLEAGSLSVVVAHTLTLYSKLSTGPGTQTQKQKQRQTCVHNVYITPLHDTFLFLFLLFSLLYIFALNRARARRRRRRWPCNRCVKVHLQCISNQRVSHHTHHSSHLWKFSPFLEQCLAPLQQLEQRNQLCFSSLTQALQYRRVNLPGRLHPLPW